MILGRDKKLFEMGWTWRVMKEKKRFLVCTVCLARGNLESRNVTSQNTPGVNASRALSQPF